MYLKCKTNTKLFVELKYLLFTLNVTCMNCSTAGAVTGAITTPLDVIKTRLMIQVWQMEPLSSSCCIVLHVHAFQIALMFWFMSDIALFFSLLLVQGSGNQYKGIFDCVQTIIREEGPPALLKVCVLLFLSKFH